MPSLIKRARSAASESAAFRANRKLAVIQMILYSNAGAFTQADILEICEVAIKRLAPDKRPLLRHLVKDEGKEASRA